MHPLAFAAKVNNEDTPNFHQVMNGPDAEGFYKAMGKEMEQLESKDPWDVIPLEEVPSEANGLAHTPTTIHEGRTTNIPKPVREARRVTEGNRMPAIAKGPKEFFLTPLAKIETRITDRRQRHAR